MEKGRCPVCGKVNGCHVMLGKDHDSCWCMKVKINPKILEYVPKEYEGVSCVCMGCTMEFEKTRKIKKVYDMHIHSTASDGTLTPGEVMKRAKEKNLMGISLTDHDTIDGLEEAEKTAKELGLDFIPGIELSTNLYGKDVHILGYFVDTKDSEFLEFLEEMKGSRDRRNLRILEKLKKYRINITEEELNAEAKGEIRGRLHIANILIAKGHAYSKAEAFANYLGKGGVAYEERQEFTPQLGVKALKKNGALAFMAHPKLYSASLKEVEHLVKELKEIGLDGIECEYATFNEQDKAMYRELAKKHNLLISGGSDYHGLNREETDIGSEGITYSQLESLREKIRGGN